MISLCNRYVDRLMVTVALSVRSTRLSGLSQQHAYQCVDTIDHYHYVTRNNCGQCFLVISSDTLCAKCGFHKNEILAIYDKANKMHMFALIYRSK